MNDKIVKKFIRSTTMNLRSASMNSDSADCLPCFTYLINNIRQPNVSVDLRELGVNVLKGFFDVKDISFHLAVNVQS